MLIQPDKNELGDKRLNPEEAVKREREELLKVASRFKVSHQDELSDADRSSGPKIYWRQLLYRLQKLNPLLRYKDSRVDGKDTVALYFPKTDAEKINDGSFVTIALTEKERFFRDYRYVGGFDKDYLPFYSHLILDTSLLPTREVRGVMTVLLMLIKSKVITLEQVKAEFGNPADDQRSDIFMEQAKSSEEKANV